MAMSYAPTVPTYADNLPAGIPHIISTARYHEDQATPLKPLCMQKSLLDHKGEYYNEISVDKFNASYFDRTSYLDDPVEITNQATKTIPGMKAIHLAYHWSVDRRLSPNQVRYYTKLQLMAMDRLEDQEGLLLFNTLTNSMGSGASDNLDASIIQAICTRLSNADDAGHTGVPKFVLHPYALHDLKQQLTMTGNVPSGSPGIGYRPLTPGLTQDLLKSGGERGFVRELDGAMLYRDSFIEVNSNAVNCGAFYPDGIWFVKGRPQWTRTWTDPRQGGDTHHVAVFRESCFHSPEWGPQWIWKLAVDGTAPTS